MPLAHINNYNESRVSIITDKTTTFPPPLVLDSLMNLFSMPSITQPIADIWSDFAERGKGKGNDIDPESEQHEEPSGKESRMPKKAGENPMSCLRK